MLISGETAPDLLIARCCLCSYAHRDLNRDVSDFMPLSNHDESWWVELCTKRTSCSLQIIFSSHHHTHILINQLLQQTPTSTHLPQLPNITMSDYKPTGTTSSPPLHHSLFTNTHNRARRSPQGWPARRPRRHWRVRSRQG